MTNRTTQNNERRWTVGTGAILLGVLMGFAVMGINSGVNRESLTAAAAPALAQRCQTNSRAGQVNAPIQTDQNCMIQCAGGPSGQGPKGKNNPACLCGKELGNADAGVTNCYNPGDCRPPGGLPACGSVEKPKLPGEEKPKGEEQGKGGEMPKLPELPKAGGGGDKPPPTDPTQEECKKEPKPAHCPNTGISGLLGNLFGTNSTTSSSTANVVQTTFKSVANKLSAFLTGGESAPSVNTSVSNTNTPASINNPTQAVVTPVTPSASNAANVTSQTNTGSTNSTQGTGSPASGQPVVTGFNSSASADVNTSTGPILSAIRSVTSRIQEILSALF